MRHKNTPTQRIINSLVFVEKDENTISVDFKDKGLKIEITDEYAVISTTFHKHIFDAMTTNQYSSPYLFIKQFVEIALNHSLVEKDEQGMEYMSYKKLAEYMATEEAPREEMIIFQYCDMWLFNIYQPLNTLQSDTISSFIVYMNYLSNLANTSIILNENKKDVTNKMYISKYINVIKDMTKDLEERVVLKGVSDDELREKMAEEVTKEL